MAHEGEHFDERWQHRHDPLADGISDSIAAGFQALETVVAGLRGSLAVPGRGRGAAGGPYGPGYYSYFSSPVGPPSHEHDGPPPGPGGSRPGGPRAGRGRRHGPPPPRYSPLFDELADLFAEMLGRASEVAHAVSESMTEHDGRAREHSDVAPILRLEAKPGEEVASVFAFWNTTPKALREVRVDATSGVGNLQGVISAAEVLTIEPKEIAFVRSGASATVDVKATVPHSMIPGVYRGLVQADPGGAFVVVELTVTEPDASSEEWESAVPAPEVPAPE